MALITEYIQTLLDGDDLFTEQAGALLDTIFEGDVPEVQIAAFLTAMRIKGPTSTELAGLAGSLRSHAVPVKVDIGNLVDTCGTGGGRFKTCNVSTAAAVVVAGAGAYVAKHGNRGITSGCGSADVLAELGVKIDASADLVAKCIKEAHIGFMFAPMFHPAMKYVQPIRKSLGFRTVFNILGPLASPASVPCQLMGVADEKLLDIIPEALKLLGTRRAMVVHSDGLDEISITGVTKIVELKDGTLSTSELNPKDLGVQPVDINELKVTDAAESAAILRNILSGKETGPKKDIVILNAAAAVIVAGLANSFDSAFQLAAESITNGNAQDCLDKLIAVSNG